MVVMEFLSKKLREVEFSEKLRGFNKDEVDEFLEQAAVEASVLEEKLARAQELALELEDKLKHAGSSKTAVPAVAPTPAKVAPVAEAPKAAPVIDDKAIADKMSKTLLIAQKTADEIISQAQNQANAMITSAQNDARKLENEVKKSIEAEVVRLKKVKAQLEQEIQELSTLISKERDDLAGSLSHLADMVRNHLSSNRIDTILGNDVTSDTYSETESNNVTEITEDRNEPVPVDIDLFEVDIDKPSTMQPQARQFPKPIGESGGKESLFGDPDRDESEGGNVRVVEYHTFEVPKIQG